MHSILNNEYSKLKKSQYSILNIKRNKKNYSDKAAQQRALYLMNKFDNPGGKLFYLKCAWNLSDEFIDWLVDYSSKKDCPSRYFTKVASEKMDDGE